MIDITLGRFSCPFAEWIPAQGRVFDGLFAYDTETTKIDDDRPYLTPHLVLASACDDWKGVLVPRAEVPAFFAAHAGQGFVAHNAAFDLKVTQAALGEGPDLYDLVERSKVWDTMILKRLLSLATAGHTARGEAGLDDCVQAHLGLALPKGLVDAEGRDVRIGFGRFLGRPLAEVPEVYLRYASGDPLATWYLFRELNERIKDVLRDAPKVWGYVDAGWLRDSIRRFGPLTHHIQLRASIVTDVLRPTASPSTRPAGPRSSSSSRPSATRPRRRCAGPATWWASPAATRPCSRSWPSSPASTPRSSWP